MPAGRWMPWRAPAPAAPEPAPPSAPSPSPSAVPVALRAPTVPHHWLTVVVARPSASTPVPVPQARVAVRAFSRESARPGDVVARGTSGPDGTVSLFLPTGRYAITASDGRDSRAATLTLEHAGRAMLVLQGSAPRVLLTVEAFTAEGAPAPGAEVDVRDLPPGTPAARGVTDERGVAAITLAPGAYEVRVGDATARTYVEADTVVRLRAEGAPRPSRRWGATPSGRARRQARSRRSTPSGCAKSSGTEGRPG